MSVADVSKPLEVEDLESLVHERKGTSNTLMTSRVDSLPAGGRVCGNDVEKGSGGVLVRKQFVQGTNKKNELHKVGMTHDRKSLQIWEGDITQVKPTLQSNILISKLQFSKFIGNSAAS